MEITISPYIIWNLIMTVIIFPLGFLIRNVLSEQKRLDILVNKKIELNEKIMDANNETIAQQRILQPLQLELKDTQTKTRKITEEKNKKKKLSGEVGKLKQKGQDASHLMEQVKAINISIKELDDKIQNWEREVREKIFRIPNIPENSVPDGVDDSANKLFRDWGTNPDFSFKPNAEFGVDGVNITSTLFCLLYTSPSPRDS